MAWMIYEPRMNNWRVNLETGIDRLTQVETPSKISNGVLAGQQINKRLLWNLIVKMSEYV